MKRIMTRTCRHMTQLLCELRNIYPLARRVLRKPAILRQILVRAHRAQLAFIVAALLMLFVVPPALNSVTSTVFPPKSKDKFLGFIKKKKESQAKRTADTVIMTTAYAASGGAIFILIWLAIPTGVKRAEKISHEQSDRAEAESNNKPGPSLRLFRTSLGLTVDPNRERAIAGHMMKLAEIPGMSQSSNATSVDFPRETENALRAIGNQAATAFSQDKTEPSGERYRLEQELGRGAMGVVYCAWDEVLDRKVALKQLASHLAADEEFVSRFRTEAKALAKLTHPNILQVYDLIEYNNRFYMALEYIEGGDLAELLESKGTLSVEEAAGLLIPVAQALAYAHQQGIVHRDLKPANILLTESRIPKISDFGIAKLTQSSSSTATGLILGSPQYMSPEQACGGNIDSRTDIYALGITLYQLLTGKVPFSGDPSSVLARHLSEEPVLPTEPELDIPEELKQLIMRLLAKKPDDRPADMNEVALLLGPYATSSVATVLQ